MIAVQTGLKSGLRGMRGQWTRCCPVSDRWGWRFTDEIHLLMVCVLLYECLNRVSRVVSSSGRRFMSCCHHVMKRRKGNCPLKPTNGGLQYISCDKESGWETNHAKGREERDRQSSTISIRCLHWEVEKVKKKRRKELLWKGLEGNICLGFQVFCQVYFSTSVAFFTLSISSWFFNPLRLIFFHSIKCSMFPTEIVFLHFFFASRRTPFQENTKLSFSPSKKTKK